MNIDQLQDQLVALNYQAAEEMKTVFESYREQVGYLVAKTEQVLVQNTESLPACANADYSTLQSIRMRAGCYLELAKEHFQVPMVELNVQHEACANEQALKRILQNIAASCRKFEFSNDVQQVYVQINQLHQEKQTIAAVLENREQNSEMNDQTSVFDAESIVNGMCSMGTSLVGLLRREKYNNATQLIKTACQDTFCIPMEDGCYDQLIERQESLQQTLSKKKWLNEILKLIGNNLRWNSLTNFEDMFESFCNASTYMEEQTTNLQFLLHNNGKPLDILIRSCEGNVHTIEADILSSLHAKRVEDAIKKTEARFEINETLAFLQRFDGRLSDFEAEVKAFEQETVQIKGTLLEAIQEASTQLVSKMGVFRQYSNEPEVLLQEGREMARATMSLKATEWLLGHCGGEESSGSIMAKNIELQNDIAMLKVLDLFGGRSDDFDNCVPQRSFEQPDETLDKHLEEYDYAAGVLKSTLHSMQEELISAAEAQNKRISMLVGDFNEEMSSFLTAYKNEVRAAYEQIFYRYAAEYNERVIEANCMRTEDILSRLLQFRMIFSKIVDTNTNLLNGSHSFDELKFAKSLDRAQQSAFAELQREVTVYKQSFDSIKEEIIQLEPYKLMTADSVIRFAQLKPQSCAAGSIEDNEVVASLRAANEVEAMVCEPKEEQVESNSEYRSKSNIVSKSELHNERRRPTKKTTVPRRYKLVRLLKDGSVEAEAELLVDKIALYERGKRPEQIQYSAIKAVSGNKTEAVLSLISGNVAVFRGPDANAFRSELLTRVAV